MMTRPQLIFADEPTGNLDSKSATEMLELSRVAVDTFGQTLVMVTHDARAASYADRVVFLADGRIVSELGRSDDGGDPRRAQAHRRVNRVPHRTEVGAVQEASAVQHRAVDHARRGVPLRHARLHRHHQPHVRRPLRRRVYQNTDAYVRSVVDDRPRDGEHPAGPDAGVRRGHGRGCARRRRRAGGRPGVRADRRLGRRRHRRPRPGRTDVRHELGPRRTDRLGAHRGSRAPGPNELVIDQGTRRARRPAHRRHGDGAHPDRSARVPARRHGQVRERRLTRRRERGAVRSRRPPRTC